MTDTDLLQLFAESVREQLFVRHEEWDDLARGRLTLAETVARARARGDLSEEEISLACELFAPSTQEFDDNLADQLLASIEENRAKTSVSDQTHQGDLTIETAGRRVP